MSKFKEGLLKKFQEKIERNAIKSELEYVTKKGIEQLRRGVPENQVDKKTEVVYLKRSIMPLGDWTRIYPPIDENGKINWANLLFGGRRNLVKLLVVMAIVAMVLSQFQSNFTYIKQLETLCQQIAPNLLR